jgi:mono/diheme cytochrome c family protein
MVVATSAHGSIALFEKNGCGSCHGDKGQGVQGLAPPLRNNAFVKSASTDEIKETILKGRKGDKRRHPQIPGGMPPNPVPEAEVDPLVKFVKEEMQR